MRFERFIVIRNPVSTRATRGEYWLAEIRRLFPKAEIIVVNTLPGGRMANSTLLRPYAEKLGPRTLLCVVAGDGTINLTVETLLTDPDLPATARRTPLLPLWGGNANDLAHMLNGPAGSLERVLTGGRIVAIKPLSITMTCDGDGDEQTRLAVCYASFGASAFAAQVLGHVTRGQHPLHALPGGRFVRELTVASQALRQAPMFTISEAGRTHTVYEMNFVNGSRFAKVNGVPLQITDEAFYRITVEHKGLAGLVYRAVRIARGRDHQRPERRAAFTVHDSAWAQFDGETMQVPAGTAVSLTLGRRPFYALTSRYSG